MWFINILFNYRKDAELMREPLQIKTRSEAGNKIITVRIKEDTLTTFDKIATESNYLRNELISIILRYGVNNIEII